MDWTEVLALMAAVFVANIGVILPLFLWTRSEANADRREYANERRSIQDVQREDRKDLLQISRNIENTMQAIQQEMKDFHTRLCNIEIGKNK